VSDYIDVPCMVTEDVTATTPRLSPGTLHYDGLAVTLAIDDPTFVTSENTLVAIPAVDDPIYASVPMWGPVPSDIELGVIFLGFKVKVQK